MENIYSQGTELSQNRTDRNPENSSPFENTEVISVAVLGNRI